MLRLVFAPPRGVPLPLVLALPLVVALQLGLALPLAVQALQEGAMLVGAATGVPVVFFTKTSLASRGSYFASIEMTLVGMISCHRRLAQTCLDLPCPPPATCICRISRRRLLA